MPDIENTTLDLFREVKAKERGMKLAAAQFPITLRVFRQIAVKLGGRTKPQVCYIADFAYKDKEGIGVVEDAKSPHLRKDPYFRLKMHLMKHIHSC